MRTDQNADVWRELRRKPAARWRPVDNVCSVIGFLMRDGTFNEDAAVAWLRSRHQQLARRTPLDVLADDDFDAVVAAAEDSLGTIANSAARPRPQPAAVPAGTRGKEIAERTRT
jgi:hypothetical protein